MTNTQKSEQPFDQSPPVSTTGSKWVLECGCKGTLSPNEITDTCEKHSHRKGDSFTGTRPPTTLDWPAPRPIEDRTQQHESYYVLSDAERAKGFVRPVRDTYTHLTCGTNTTMGRALAETYARQPDYYGETFCVTCGAHFRVGEDGEFVWKGTNEKVGT